MRGGSREFQDVGGVGRGIFGMNVWLVIHAKIVAWTLDGVQRAFGRKTAKSAKKPEKRSGTV